MACIINSEAIVTSSEIVQFILPSIVAVLIFGIGMGLAVKDFLRLTESPAAAIGGLINQTLILPLIAFSLLFVFDLEYELALGLIILAASPSATTSNLYTLLGHGDVALSMAITSTSKLLSVFTIPLALGIGMSLLDGSDKNISLSFIEHVTKIAWMILLPLITGMYVRNLYPLFCDKAQNWVKRISIIFLSILILGLVIKEHKQLASRFISIAPAAVSLCLLSMLSAYLISSNLKLSRAQSITVIIDSMMQSGGIAMVVAISLTGSTSAALPAAMYSLFMYMATGCFVLYMNFTHQEQYN